MKLQALGIDLAKNVFHLVGLDSSRQVVVRKRCSRTQVLAFGKGAGASNRHENAFACGLPFRGIRCWREMRVATTTSGTVPRTKRPILCPTGSNLPNPLQHLHDTGLPLN